MEETWEFLDPKPKRVKNLIESATLKRLNNEHRGKGRGRDYKPFLTVRDVPSGGRAHRAPSATHGRTVQALSDLEFALFLLLDMDAGVIDIREQYPLDPDVTYSIAARHRLGHPKVKNHITVMTTDFVVDRIFEGRSICEAISVKYTTALDSKRTVEKLELERLFWEQKNIPFYIFTENEVPATLLENLKWLYPFQRRFNLDEQVRLETFRDIVDALQVRPNQRIATAMASVDQLRGDETGTHLAMLRHLIAQGAFVWNIRDINHCELVTGDLVPSGPWERGDNEYVDAQ